jgi:hypothetical protein
MERKLEEKFGFFLDRDESLSPFCICNGFQLPNSGRECLLPIHACTVLRNSSIRNTYYVYMYNTICIYIYEQFFGYIKLYTCMYCFNA